MTYRGSIKNGVVVFDEPVTLDEGTLVEVNPVTAEVSPRPGTPEAMRLLADITWAGDPEELRRLEAEVQAIRDADLTPMDEPNPLDEK